MHLLKRTGILFFALLVFFGSGGWVLTDHLCRNADDSCNSKQEMSCCCTGEEKDQPQPTNKNIFSEAGGECCVTTSSYFSMPLFRLETVQGSSVDLLIADFSFPIVEFAFSSVKEIFVLPYKPPPNVNEGEEVLRLTGQLLI